MQVLDEMKILIQQAHEKLKKEGRLLNDKELAEIRWAHQQTKANNEIENIYFSQEEEELFSLFEEARLPLLFRSDFINIYLEKTLALDGYNISLPRNEA